MTRLQGGGKEATVTKYRRIKAPEHPLADKDGCLRIHRLVLFNKIGYGVHKCNWCRKDLTWLGPNDKIVVDHLDDDGWNNEPENLVPSCRNCNSNRAKRPDYFTHCKNGHPWVEANIYWRLDGKGKQCKICSYERKKRRK